MGTGFGWTTRVGLSAKIWSISICIEQTKQSREYFNVLMLSNCVYRRNLSHISYSWFSYGSAIQITKLEFGNVGFWGARKKIRERGKKKKTLKQDIRSSKKLKPHDSQPKSNPGQIDGRQVPTLTMEPLDKIVFVTSTKNFWWPNTWTFHCKVTP